VRACMLVWLLCHASESMIMCYTIVMETVEAIAPLTFVERGLCVARSSIGLADLIF